MGSSILHIKDLTVRAYEGGAPKHIIERVNFEVPELSVMALVGGSGSGKTTTGLSVLRLLGPGLDIVGGQIDFMGKDLLALSPEEMRKLRGAQISMIFQEPLDAFNPVFSIGYQVDEVLCFHTDMTKKQRNERVHQLLSLVGLLEPERTAKAYPHQLSGGMRQRAMIAQAIAANPRLLIADEPTSNLDVTLQARIIDLFRKLRDELKLSVLLITHDLGMVEHFAERVVVMSEGAVVESAQTRTLIERPSHEYTKKLIKAFKV